MAISRYFGIPLLTAMSLAISLLLLPLKLADASSAQSPAVVTDHNAHSPV